MKQLLKNKFFKWLNKEDSLSLSPNTKKYFDQLRSIWNLFTPDSEEFSPDTDQLWQELSDRIRRDVKIFPVISFQRKEVFWRKRKLVLSFVFSLIIFFSIIYYYVYTNALTYQTDRKEFTSITLPDSSTVKLNCSSRIDLDRKFSQQSRTVTLNGEAYFSVKQGEVPFLIKTAIGIIEVVGTEFNVKAREDFLELMVNKGVVKLSSRVGDKDSTVVLHKGEYSRCFSGGFPTDPDTMTLGCYPGWLYHRLSCKNTSLLEVCREIERRFDVSIHLADKADESITVTGIFSTSDLNTLLETICILIKKEYKFDKGFYLIY